MTKLNADEATPRPWVLPWALPWRLSTTGVNILDANGVIVLKISNGYEGARKMIEVVNTHDALVAERDALRAALKFYANRENHQRQLVSDVLMSEIDVDEGHKARAALKEGE